MVDGLSSDLHSHIASMRRYAMALAGDTVEADDLVQESLRRAIAYTRKGGSVRNPRAFLFTVLHNVWANQVQSNGSAGQHIPIDDVAATLGIDGNQQRQVELKALLRAMNDLPKDHRQVLLLVCLEGFAYREAAAMLGVPIGTVMSRLARARKNVIAQISAEQPARQLKRVK
ncbi:RNA polymerase sigma factor [Ferruginivarius sediminum]|uniref:RNA polymerase sigma factor n=2 Tax=Ferruginivarius sediminum TaxID=2661937 RepID=A0A369T7Y2_9PROT|nr:sigma-70 family RNA polymerase sigma factor [Ferruginivarius sediminum]RDD60287.1 RNA polymerase sigma factor [Ferruginivarius sediminum]